MDAMKTEADGSDPMELLHVKYEGQHKIFTRYRLQETLMLMGCRPKDAVTVTQEAFAVFTQYQSQAKSGSLLDNKNSEEKQEEELPVALPWHLLHQYIYSSLARLDYVKPHHLLDFEVAKEITQRNQSFAVLLGGTSGTGKSTLASLLAARLRLTTVLPTDSVRHVLRSFTLKEEKPCAFVSTYQAGDALSPEMIAAIQGDRGDMSTARLHKKMVLKGYKMQSDLVLKKLDRVLTMFEERKQSLVVEGVHLNTDDLLTLVKKHPTCVPFMIYISNENKHRERFAVRARHMTIDPQENKYIKHFDNIRIIQRHLCKHADRCLIPKIDNTNVDRSIATIHSTLVRVLRKLDRGEKLEDDKIGKFVMLSREHENSIKKAWSSKGVRKAMRPLLKQKVSKRLLLRRLLAEQTLDTFGAPGLDQGEDSSSSEEEEEEDAGREADDERNGDEDDEDEQATVVGSLISVTNTRDHLATADYALTMPLRGQPTPARLAAQKRMFLDEIKEHAAGTSDDASSICSLSQAVRQAAVWRASQPLTKYTNWEFHVPLPSPEATFSDVMEYMPGFAAAVEKGKRPSLCFEDRRKSWIAGDRRTDAPKSLAAQKSSSRTLPPNASRQFKAFIEIQRVEGEAQLQMQRTQQQLQQQVLPVSHQLPPIGRRKKAVARRVQSLPPEQMQDSSSSLDFDLDSVSVTDANEDIDHVSQTSSSRDGCVSPLEHSQDDTDSHFEVSSQSSVE